MTAVGGTGSEATPTRAHQVYELLRSSIIGLERPPGARLSENRVAADLGVSRTPVREALQRLSEERFVVRDERGSFVVAGVTHRDVDGLCDLLELVDAYLFGRAARVAGPTAAELTEIAQRLRAAADEPDLEAWSTADGRFHELVNELADNEWASRVAKMTRSRLHRFWLNHEARTQRFARFEELRKRWDEQHARLKKLVVSLQQAAAVSHAMASRYAAAQTRLRKFEEIGPPPEPPREQDITMRLKGGRTGVRAITVEKLELTGLMEPFDLEVFQGERVAVLGSNGSGKSHFLRLLAGQPVDHSGAWKLGARVVPGHFAQTHAYPELEGRTLLDILWAEHALQRGPAMSSLRRYELEQQAETTYERLSGGQKARVQILRLELGGATSLLLDEPTDNLDLESAEALQAALESYEGTVLAVTHDRWFAKTFDRFLIFGADSVVRESSEPVWDEGRVQRDR